MGRLGPAQVPLRTSALGELSSVPALGQALSRASTPSLGLGPGHEFTQPGGLLPPPPRNG